MIPFRPNPLFAAAVSRQASFKAAMVGEAERVKEHVETAAPVVSGDYSRSIRTAETPDGSVVYTADQFGHLVEWGSANNFPYAPLRRGVLAAGLRLDEQPK